MPWENRHLKFVDGWVKVKKTGWNSFRHYTSVHNIVVIMHCVFCCWENFIQFNCFLRISLSNSTFTIQRELSCVTIRRGNTGWLQIAIPSINVLSWQKILNLSVHSNRRFSTEFIKVCNILSWSRWVKPTLSSPISLRIHFNIILLFAHIPLNRHFALGINN
jgi:hypothetical protein